MRVRPASGRPTASPRTTTRPSGGSTSATASIGWIVGLAYGLWVLYTILYTPGLLLLVLPAGMLAWFGFLRPIVRRRHYRAIQALTRTWQLRPVARA